MAGLPETSDGTTPVAAVNDERETRSPPKMAVFDR